MRLGRWMPALMLGFIALLPCAAMAHPGHGEGDFTSGFTHPLLGLDHLIAMVSIGLWASQIGGRTVLLLPGVFVSMMLAGGAAALAGLELPAMESVILASVLVLGLFIASATKLPMTAGMVITALFAFFHGAAHGSELDGASPTIFAGGALLASVLLHAAGVLIGWGITRNAGAIAVRVTGGLIAAAGLLMAASVL